MQGKRFEMFNMRSQQVKFNAFFQYLKSFSEAGLDTLQKLENEFNKEMRRKLKHGETLATIKNLLSSYQIFILEIKDSCDFVEIGEFGYCIGKTFLQLLKIIKWFLKAWLKDTRKYEKARASLQSDPNEEAIPQQNLCAFCQQVIRSAPYGRQARGKRKGVNICDVGSEMRDAKLLHRRQVNHLMQAKENILEKYTLRQIQSKKHIPGELSEMDILNRKHIAMKLQISNNESVLEQVLNEFSIKTQAMSRFVSNTQANCIQDFKFNQQTDYVQFQEQMRAVITEKYNEAKEKLKGLVMQKIGEFQRHRKDKLLHKEVQTMPIDFSDKEKNQLKIKQLTTAYQKLKNELESEKALTQSLKKLLESKSIEFQREFLNFRKEVITSDIKSKHYLKSLKSFKECVDEVDAQHEEEDKDDASIDLEDHPQARQRKHLGKVASGNIKQRRRRYSIKFTLQEGLPNEDNEDYINQSLQNYNHNINEAYVQTDPICFLEDNNAPPYPPNKQKTPARSLIKEFRHNKAESEKIQYKKNRTQLYSHVKSKIVDIIQKEPSVRSVRRELKQTRSSCMGEMVKKLSVDYLFQHRKEPSNAPVRVYKLSPETTFTQVVSFYLTKDDIWNLFLNDKNAHNYQCLIYRNSLFSLANVNQKRMISLSKQIESSDLEWISRKETAVDQSVEGKIVYAFYHQLNALKRRQKEIYQQIKQLMRSPYEISKKVEVIQLQNLSTTDDSKDIEIGELKKMLNVILKFHCDCIGQEKDSVCEHIVNFSQKIGIRLV